ncbi:PilN domain-containing protein [Planosporangium thailandense]|uniref:PilN domain-containing protein n=1 Tax=Planosporangium thailandense TaxID=765197 RepID=A0ABX0Y702_9ACTN|nr:PilN domain-containing protein [Planosporangium thailandense]NJC74196.1 PilN domain-containing protein [Planosporangium thailandense]
MTTTLMPPGSVPPGSPVPAESPARMLSIAANLLPPEIVHVRRVRTVRRTVVSALAVFVVLLGGWYGLARYQAATERAGLSGAELDVRRLERLQKDYATLIGVQRESQTIRSELSTLLASDLRWSGVISAIESAAPTGVSITNVAGSLNTAGNGTGGNGTGGSATGPRLPDTTGHRLVGTVTITGTASSKAAVAQYLDRLAAVPGLGNPFLDASVPDDTAERFTVRLDITDAALGGRYTEGGK